MSDSRKTWVDPITGLDLAAMDELYRLKRDANLRGKPSHDYRDGATSLITPYGELGFYEWYESEFHIYRHVPVRVAKGLNWFDNLAPAKFREQVTAAYRAWLARKTDDVFEIADSL